jgi:predicted RNase H-related nuclease YkuK (DUF458 family)
MSKIIIHNNGSSIKIINPLLEDDSKIKEFISLNVPNGVESVVIDNTQFPTDIEFGMALEVSGGLKFNANKAKAIWKNKWREARKSRLQALDVEFMKAIELGEFDKQADIGAKKQALRDVTLTEIPGTTPEEIKSVWPEVLNDTI